MNHQIEIYIRPSGDSTILNIYVPENLREKFINGINTGTFDSSNLPINIEFSVLPHWLSNKDSRTAQFTKSADLHVRLPISSINTHFGE